VIPRLYLLCAVAAVGTATAQNPRDLGCADSYELETSLGRFTNNVWNKQAAGQAPYRQCIRSRKAAAGQEFGWSWEWPARGTAFVSFPAVVMGWKPWNGGTSTRPELPVRADEIRVMRLSYTIQTSARGRHNLAAAIWLTRTGKTQRDANPTDISADINIWTDGFEMNPTGKQLGNVTIGGTAFEVWNSQNMGDASGANAARWNHVVYRSTSRQVSASLDIKGIIDDAVARGLVSPQHYVSSIELGNEIMSGRGETWIRALALEIR
jgi:hypothetical protein